MKTIQDYIQERLTTDTSHELKDKLGISLSMLSSYKKSYKPSLEVAKRVKLIDSLSYF